MKQETSEIINTFIDELDQSNESAVIYDAVTKVNNMFTQDWQAMNYFGIRLFEKENFELAKYFFGKSLQVNPFNKDAYYNLAVMHLKLRNVDQAVLNLLRITLIDPYDKPAKELILRIYKMQALNENLPVSQSGRRKRVATIIEFSSLDDAFIDACIDNAIMGTDYVMAAAFDKFYRGQNDTEGLKKIITRNQHKKVDFKIFALPEIPSSNTAVYHNLTRVMAYKELKNQFDYTLLIDGDEIVDGQSLRSFCEAIPEDLLQALFYNYWYFREPVYQSTALEHSPLIIKNDFMDFLLKHGDRVVSYQEKDRVFYQYTDIKITPPIFHHYSWVRTKEQMLDKVRHWGHRNDKNWTELVEEEFSREFNGTDFVHGYKYNIVPNKFNIKL